MAITDETLISTEGQAPHSTVPDIEIPSAGLLEAPSVSEADLRASAAELVQQWQLLPKSSAAKGLGLRLKSLSTRLKERLAACKAIASKELTPQLEFLESTRMFEAALIGAKSASDTFATLPLLPLPDATSDHPARHEPRRRLSCRRQGHLVARIPGHLRPTRHRNSTPSDSRRSAVSSRRPSKWRSLSSSSTAPTKPSPPDRCPPSSSRPSPRLSTAFAV